MIVKIKKLTRSAKKPTRNNEEDAGFDVYVDGFQRWNNITEKNQIYENTKEMQIHNRWVVGCKTGLAIEIPKGHYLKIVPRSGTAYKYGITIVNTPATIDAGYRDEIIIGIINTTTKPYTVKIGDRIAQLILRKLVKTEYEEVEELSESERGEKGFGSSGR